ncbi:MAG: NUDIX hydrolase [SAR202 cluster bacterium]|nr:NUDIX hydrolase [SAR202 cluster bacterium]
MNTEARLSTETVFEGKIVTVRVDAVSLANGVKAVREVVEHRPAVAIVPFDDDGQVILVSQFRYPVGEQLLEVPAGIIEEGETPEQCADRELQEEIGYRAREMRSLGSFWTAPGFSDELMYAFVATGLEPSRLEPDEDEDITVVRVPVSRVREMIEASEIRDSKTIAALLMTC